MNKYSRIGGISNLPDVLKLVTKSNVKAVYMSMLSIIVVIVFIVLLVIYLQNILSSNKHFNSSSTYESFVKALLKENVQVVLVQDPNSIRKSNPQSGDFYKEAQKDDVVFLLTNHNLIILYRPSEEKILSIAEVN